MATTTCRRWAGSTRRFLSFKTHFKFLYTTLPTPQFKKDPPSFFLHTKPWLDVDYFWGCWPPRRPPPFSSRKTLMMATGRSAGSCPPSGRRRRSLASGTTLPAAGLGTPRTRASRYSDDAVQGGGCLVFLHTTTDPEEKRVKFRIWLYGSLNQCLFPPAAHTYTSRKCHAYRAQYI